MSSSFFSTVGDGLLGAVIAAGVSAFTFWRTGKRTRSQLADAWKIRADELDTRITNQWQEQIGFVKQQLEQCQSETARLQKLLGREQRRGDL
jgi:hypothetical protein